MIFHVIRHINDFLVIASSGNTHSLYAIGIFKMPGIQVLNRVLIICHLYSPFLNLSMLFGHKGIPFPPNL